MLVLQGLAASTAHADIPPFYALGPRPDDTQFAASVLFFDAPRWSGSSETRRTWRPSATVLRTDGWFADTVSGIGWNASRDTRFEYGVRATLGIGRPAVAYVPGAKRVPDTANLGTFANWNATERLSLQSSLRYGAGAGHDGTLLDLGASFDLLQWDHGSFAMQTSANFASRPFMRSYYGVNAGPQRTMAGFSLASPLHRRIYCAMSLDRTRLSGTVSASPIVARRVFNSFDASLSFLF